MRLSHWLAAVGTALSLPVSAGAQVIPARPHFISQQQRAEDPRLEQRVTIENPRVYTGELLELLAEETGVEISATPGDGSEDELLTVFVRDEPLVEVLNAVWSLVGYRDAEWEWRRTGPPGAYQYRLLRTEAARQLPERLRAEVERLREAHVEAVLAGIHLSPQERERLAERDPTLSLLSNENAVAALRLFAEALSPEQQRAVLQGRDSIRVPVEALSEAGQAWVRQQWERNPAWRVDRQTGARERVPPPPGIVFAIGGPPDALVPRMVIGLERPRPAGPDGSVRIGSVGGNAYLPTAAFRSALPKRFAEGWLLLRDQQEHPVAGRALPPEVRERLLTVAGPQLTHLFVTDVRELASAAAIPVIARLPRTRPHTTTVLPPGDVDTIGEWLARLGTVDTPMQHKWRGNILVLRTPDWFGQYEDGSQVPWAVVRALRIAEERNDGFLPISALAAAIIRLRDAQLMELRHEYPTLWGLGGLRGLFLLYAAEPEITQRIGSEQGAPLAGIRALAERLELNDPLATQVLEREGAVALRLIRQDSQYAGRPAHRYRFQLLDADGEPLPESGPLLGRLQFFSPQREPEASGRPNALLR